MGAASGHRRLENVQFAGIVVCRRAVGVASRLLGWSSGCRFDRRRAEVHQACSTVRRRDGPAVLWRAWTRAGYSCGWAVQRARPLELLAVQANGRRRASGCALWVPEMHPWRSQARGVAETRRPRRLADSCPQGVKAGTMVVMLACGRVGGICLAAAMSDWPLTAIGPGGVFVVGGDVPT